MSRSPLIEVRDLVRQVPNLQRPLLNVANFRVLSGERIGLRGPTGSGKSSLLRALSGLDPWQQGQLRFHARSIAPHEMPAYRRQVIYLPQRPALIPGTVEDNLRMPFALSIAAAGDPRAATVPLLTQLGEPESFLKRPSDGLSGGERQLVGLLRAIQLRPEVLLLDEPTASLDADSAKRFEAAVCRWHEETGTDQASRAYVIASHQPEQVSRMSDRVVVIDQGMIVETVNDE